MKLDMAQIQTEYEDSRGWREFIKYVFSIGTPVRSFIPVKQSPAVFSRVI